MKKKKNMIIGGLLAVVFLMSVGYAAFASNLTITGTANTSSWIIKITNIREKTKTSGVTSKGTSYTDLTANFNCELTLPGDSITYEVTVENQGNIDAAVKEITKTVSNSRYIEVTYSGLVQGQMLYKQGAENSTATMEVTVTFKDKEYEGTFTETITSNISLNLNFEQEGNNIDTTKKYLITYDSQGGTPVESRYVGWTESNLRSVEIPARLGYKLEGWYTEPNGAGEKVYSNVTTSDIIQNQDYEGITLYASWSDKLYKIIYDSQGGSTIAPAEYYWSSNYLFSSSSPSKNGYVFAGWYTKTNGKGLKVISDTTMGDVVLDIYKYTDVAGGENGDEVTLYANWKEREYSDVIYMPRDSRTARASNLPEDVSIKCTDTNFIDNKIPTRKNYTFTGWSIYLNDVETAVPINKSIKDIFGYCPEETTIYANWTKDE